MLVSKYLLAWTCLYTIHDCRVSITFKGRDMAQYRQVIVHGYVQAFATEKLLSNSQGYFCVTKK